MNVMISSGCVNVSLCHSYPSILKGNSALPPEDRLLRFLVDNNADAEETVQCANCDQESSHKVRIDVHIYYGDVSHKYGDFYVVLSLDSTTWGHQSIKYKQ